MYKAYLTNKEGLEEYNIFPQSFFVRDHGLSAMIRLGNEQEWIGPCIESVLPWFDEIVCTLQCSTDRTESILKSFNSSKISIYKYPFESFPNGPGHDLQPRGSVYERAYFYNWSLSKTTKQWVSKWDGDMVAQDWLGSRVHELIGTLDYDVICVAGTNIVHGLSHKSKAKPATANEPRFFRMLPNVFYYTSSKCEDIHHPSFKAGKGFGEYLDTPTGSRTYRMRRHGYLHFKHAKADASASMAWPEDWQDQEHFRRIYKYCEPGQAYKGDIPNTLKGIIS